MKSQEEYVEADSLTPSLVNEFVDFNTNSFDIDEYENRLNRFEIILNNYSAKKQRSLSKTQISNSRTNSINPLLKTQTINVSPFSLESTLQNVHPHTVKATTSEKENHNHESCFPTQEKNKNEEENPYSLLLAKLKVYANQYSISSPQNLVDLIQMKTIIGKNLYSEHC